MYHKPVLLREAIELLKIQPDGTYVDATFGSGGHSREIMEQLRAGRLIAFDQDEDAVTNAISDRRFSLIPQNFRYLKNFLKAQGILSIDGALADLGISSWQIDTPERGFSIRYPGKLDMRMDQHQKINAETVVNTYPETKLSEIFHNYGEIASHRQLAQNIIESRKKVRITTTDQLAALALKFAPRGRENQFLARVFQAIRIEINEELDALKDFLMQATEMLVTGGRLVIIAYHSLEDKLVKNYFSTGNFEGRKQEDFFGNLVSPLAPVNRKIIRPTEKEINENPRSRSARLRAAEKK